MREFAIIIGAMKSGTTSLYEYMCRHPEIARCQLRKQVDFFSRDDLWERGDEWYESQWNADPETHRWAMEASPSYTNPANAETAAERMASFDGSFRLIYLLREPFDRICSHFYHSRQREEFEQDSISEALREQPSMLEVSRYTEWLAEYDERFGRDRVFLLTSEALADEPARCLREICEFLDIDADFEFPNLDKRYNTRDVQRQYGRGFSILRAIRPLRRAVKRLIPLDWRNRLKSIFTTPNPGVEYPSLDADDRAFVRDELREELSILREDPRVSVDHWELFDES